MSDTSQGPGWWIATDEKWYPPHLAPPAVAVVTPPSAPHGGHVSTPASPGPPALPNGVRVTSPWARLGAYVVEIFLAVVTLGIGWLIWAAMIGGTGQTPAKKLLNQRVIRADTMGPAGLGKMFWVRGIVAGVVAYLAVSFTLGILLLMPFWDKRKQNLWDKVSNTYVVNDPLDAWATRPNLAA